MDDEVEKLTKTEVKELGFSDRLIEALLPEPELRDNPRYRYAGAPMKLWLKSDVDRAMETDEFKEHLKVREKRSLAARKAAETRRAKTLARARERAPLIEVAQGWSEDEIRESALRSHYEWEVQKGNYWDDSYRCDDERAVSRWMVNFVRHELTDYDHEFYEMSGRTGIGEVHRLYHDAVLREIAKAYPFLEGECKRQMIGPSDAGEQGEGGA